MLEPQLYIEGTRIDLFDDVSVRITDRIKDSQDLSKIFTQYTDQFTVPASVTNNKLFQHYYNFNVISGFDARRKHPALLKLSGTDYRRGYVKLNGVDLKDNKADKYRIQFFGELTSLKDKFGEDMLEDLVELNKYNHDYDLATVKSGLTKSLVYTAGSGMSAAASETTNGEICYPLLSHTRGFQFSSTDGFYDITSGSPKVNADRLDEKDLKPGLRVMNIFEAIAEHYDITFNGELFNESALVPEDVSPLHDLYLWLHRDKGNLKSGGEDIDNANFFGAITDPASSDEYEMSLGSGTDQRVLYLSQGNFPSQNQYYEVTYNVTTGDSGSFNMWAYTVDPDTNALEFQGQTTVSDGNGTLTFDLRRSWPADIGNNNLHLYVVVSADNGISTVTPTVTIQKYVNSAASTSGVYGGASTSIVQQVIINQCIPKIKVFDFVTGIFKLFNIVAYGRSVSNLSEEQEIVCQPLQNYLAQGRAVDVSRFIDITSSTVERVNPYSTLKFTFKEPKTFLAKVRNERLRDNFGNEILETKDITADSEGYLFDGGTYDVSVPFEKMMYERLLDLDDSTPSELIYGWFVNDFKENTPEPELASPLLFFRNYRALSTDQIDWSDGSSTTTGYYNAPSNVRQDGSVTLHFGAELDEYTALDEAGENTNSLFNNYYDEFISGVYDVNARKKVVNAIMPAKFLLNYKLNDKLVINNIAHQIESIQADITTGKGKLELVRMTNRAEVYDIEVGVCYAIDYVVEPYWCQPAVSFEAV